MSEQREPQSRAMTVERLEALVGAYGADERAWPEGERGEAGALAARRLAQGQQPAEGGGDEPRVDRALREAAELDEWLAELEAPELPQGLRQRVLAAAPSTVASRGRSSSVGFAAWVHQLWPFSPAWQPVAVLVAASVLGVVLGSTLPDASDGGDGPDVAELAFGTDVEWDPEGQWEAP